MLTLCPDYYPRFHCAADRCGHTCCAGWEIDIDPDTLAVYEKLPGSLGTRLAGAISRDPAPHFLLGPGERCPFLDHANLCRLILEGGEELLCQICRDHPRFRTFLPGRTEIGLGLCCETAGALILSQKAPVRLLPEGEGEDGDATELIALRDELLHLAQDRALPLEERMDRILARCGVGAALPLPRWAVFLTELERLEDAWTELLRKLRNGCNSVDIISFRRHMQGRETEYEQLLVYFLYRHFLKAYDDGDSAGKAAFAVLSVRTLLLLGAIHYEEHGDFSFADQVEYARLYSAELEYSEDNMEAIFDLLYEEQWND